MAVSNDAFNETDDLWDVLSDSQVHRWRQNLERRRDTGTRVISKVTGSCPDPAQQDGSHSESGCPSDLTGSSCVVSLLTLNRQDC